MPDLNGLMQDFINIINSLGGISTGALLGALFTIVVKHFLDKTKAKTDRLSNLQKEVFFNLQKQAESLFAELNLMQRQVEEIAFWLSRPTFTTQLTTVDVQERLNRVSSAQVYFSEDALRKGNEVAMIFRDIEKLYIDVGKTSNITQAQCDELKSLFEAFSKSIRECKSAILDELVRAKASIV